jgi:glycosyltransferase involved in cell wall biosynthesis
MTKTIIHFPLEPYKERYTEQLCADEGGWLSSRWRENDIPFINIKGKMLREDRSIKSGSVLDANGRGYWATTQIAEFLRRYEKGEFDYNHSVIYFSDFWHPGIEALAYTFHITGKRIPMYAMLHAQSVDIFDFTYPMRNWMRHFEKGIGSILDGIFVTSKILKDLCLEAGVGNNDNLFIAGLPYNSKCVMLQYFPEKLPEKKRQVVFSSRLDWEKNPLFFLQVAAMVKEIDPSINFVFTTSSSEIRSNDPQIKAIFDSVAPSLVEVRKNQSKQDYYNTLLESTVQFNCAYQDFVSWTLLEALTCRCNPVYPFFRSFPEVLPYNFMYTPENVEDAARLILQNMGPFHEELVNIVLAFDKSWQRMYDFMNSHRSMHHTIAPMYEDSRMANLINAK